MKIARFAAGLALLIALFYFHFIDLNDLRQVVAHPGLLIAAIAACMATIPIGGLRWHILLRSQGLMLHLWSTVRIVAIGGFFSTFLPGSAGGDIVRGVHIYQVSHGRRTGALLSIFIDRLIGIGAFVLFGMFATLVRAPGQYGALEYGVFALAALFVAAIVVLFRFGHRIAQLANFFFAGRSQRLALIIDHAGQALRQYTRQWPSVLLCLALSFVMVFLTVIGIVSIAAAMQLGGLSPLEYGIAGIYATIANSLPFTPGGLGIGEGAFASACVLLAPKTAGIAYGTIFLTFRCVFVISTLPGLIVYWVYPQRAKLLVPIKRRPI